MCINRKESIANIEFFYNGRTGTHRDILENPKTPLQPSTTPYYLNKRMVNKG
jgi:hypothetical protein